jgi:hypothetical protein
MAVLTLNRLALHSKSNGIAPAVMSSIRGSTCKNVNPINETDRNSTALTVRIAPIKFNSVNSLTLVRRIVTSDTLRHGLI